MALTTNKPARTLSGATALAAAFSMLAAPAAAAGLPRPVSAVVYDADFGNAQGHRRGRYYRGNDIDAGDIIAGVLILGGIAAIAGAANDDRDERYRYPEDAGYRTPQPDTRFQRSGMDRAVDMCVAELEQRDARVGSVDSAGRTGEGWHVAGALEGGESWGCWIGNDGRISDVEIGGYGDSGEAGVEIGADEQWSDEDYARARAAQDGPTPYETAPDESAPYETAQAPDFE